jgi:hypothetical protein
MHLPDGGLGCGHAAIFLFSFNLDMQLTIYIGRLRLLPPSPDDKVLRRERRRSFQNIRFPEVCGVLFPKYINSGRLSLYTNNRAAPLQDPSSQKTQA